MPPPISREERIELDAFRSDVKKEVDDMNKAAIAHVEKIVAPFTPLAQKVETTAAKVDALEAETAKQTPILKDLAGEAKKAKRARIEARRERIRRSALDKDKAEREQTALEEKKKRDASWDKWRKRVAGIVATIVALGEAYRLFFGGHK